jgi:diguanylate cyclase (GGDEF)-like protein
VTTFTSSRARRARILLVADEPSAAAVQEDLAAGVTRVDTLLDAIGEVATCRAGDPIVAALLFDNGAPPGAHAVEALRRVDPSVVLVRVADPRATGEAPPDDRFDAVIGAPIDRRALAEALGADLVQDAPAPATPAPPAPPAVTEEAPSAEPPTQAGEVADDREAVIIDTLAPDVERTAAPTAAVTENLGDTDLVDAVMNDPGGVTTTALNLVRQQTGWSDVDLAGGEVPEGVVAVTVEAAGDQPRHLFSAMATADALRPWARWLSYWLTLDGAYRQYRLQAYQDQLTGAWNRRYCDRFLSRVLREAAERRRPITVMVFDIDDFKRYNDEYSHEAGDEILIETVALLNSVIRRCDRVCRIGGDEFAVIFADLEAPRTAGSAHPESVELIARRFQQQIATMQFPKLGQEAPGLLSISAGLATYPWDANTPEGLLRLADERALESKRRGKNHITFGAAAADAPDDRTAGPGHASDDEPASR